jgi:hypothetical protein
MSTDKSLSKQRMSKDDQTTLEDVEMVTIPKHLLESLLKGPQFVNEALTHAKTAWNNSIRTQRDELERLVDAWGPNNSQALFISCLDDVEKKLFELDGRPITDYAECLGATLIGCISNSWDYEHQMGHIEEKPKSKGLSMLGRETMQSLHFCQTWRDSETINVHRL